MIAERTDSTSAMSRSFDGAAVWRRGLMAMPLAEPIYSEPDVVTRPNGTLVTFARNSAGGPSFYDARPGAYTPRTLGGIVC